MKKVRKSPLRDMEMGEARGMWQRECAPCGSTVVTAASFCRHPAVHAVWGCCTSFQMQRAQFGCSDSLHWPTGGEAPVCAMLGLISLFYVLL